MTKGKKILAHAVLILASFLSVFPLYYMLCGATNTSIDVVRGKLIPGTYLVETSSRWLPTRIWGWQWQTPSATPS